jgi:hypothetical protein
MISITWLLLILFIFASFRLTRLIVHDKITAFIRRPFIDEIVVMEEGIPVTYTKIKGDGLQHFIGELLSCTWCTGVWSSAFLILIYVLFPSIGEILILLLAIAGAAGVVESIVNKMDL